MLEYKRPWRLIGRAHDRLAIGYRSLLPDGTPREQLRTSAFTIYAPDGSTVPGVGGAPMSAASVSAQDRGGLYGAMIHPPGSAALLVGRIGLRWELAVLLPSGERITRYSGPIDIEPGASVITGDPSPVEPGGILIFVDRRP